MRDPVVSRVVTAVRSGLDNTPDIASYLLLHHSIPKHRTHQGVIEALDQNIIVLTLDHKLKPRGLNLVLVPMEITYE